MKRLIVMACCGVFVATLVMSAEQSADARGRQPADTPPNRCSHRRTAAVSPATPSSADSPRSSTAVRMVLTATAARAPTATCRRTVSSSRRPTSRRGFGSSNGGADGIRTPMTRCSARSTRMTFAPTARTPAISATCGRTVSIRITFPLPPNVQARRSRVHRRVERDVRGRLARGSDRE